MADIVRYLTHPQVRVEPHLPVPEWGLSTEGAARITVLAAGDALGATSVIWSSEERKAVESATPLATALACALHTCLDLGENDRSATGFLPPVEFEAMADAFLANPESSVCGWERAVDAQTRIVAAVDNVLAVSPVGDVLLVGHGAVGTLLYVHLSGAPISRQYDQPAGGGNFFSFERESRRLLHGWRPLEAL
ncbi:histidine phosphatase family protein [Algicella marina]|uniref:Histidine phosphatase family protein n=1 Tax=Algicella marina TaxID=2683284 RepID=A0A6P1SSL6_9RHOB|nr:histidine phosphatase family protein [Algicella marina]QHQ33674.1 histidine phosphatase family protein [Algicella marina]